MAKNQPSSSTNLISILWWPILVLLAQLCLLAATVFFLVWTYVVNYPVPLALNNMYFKHPQASTTVLTLFGTMLGWTTTKLFVYAIRLAINVLLRRETGLQLYTISAATTVASSSLLFAWGKGRSLKWAVVSFFFFLLFIVQTSAWTTIITPKPGLRQSTGTFNDFDLTTPVLANGSLTIPFSFTAFWQSSASGLAVIRDMAAAAGAINFSTGPPADTALNISRLLPYSDFALNGTSSGILPQIPVSAYNGGWTKIEAVQQGLTANVTCAVTPEPTSLVINEVNFTNTTYVAVNISCNSSTNPSSSVVNLNATTFGFFAMCPQELNNAITLYLIIGGTGFFDNARVFMTCNIQPQLQGVFVTYNYTGIINTEPLPETLVDLPINSSSAVSSIIGALQNHLSYAQSPNMNLVIDPVYTIYDDYQRYLPSEADPTTQADLIAGYIRGVIEDAATNLRFALFSFSNDEIPRQQVQVTMYANNMLWGPAITSLRIEVIMISPLAIMMSTVVIILVSFLSIRHSDLKPDMFAFNPMSTLDMVSACSNGDVQSITFPRADHDLDTDSKTINVALYGGRDNNDGLRLSRD